MHGINTILFHSGSVLLLIPALLMKLTREHIPLLSDSSFRVSRHNAITPCLMQWHYHPEYQLVYVPTGIGQRHIGQHQGYYEDGELLLLGPNVPHLCYGYGQDLDFEELVVHFPTDLVPAELLARPELATVGPLLRRAATGLVFAAEVQRSIGPRVERLSTLAPWERFVELLGILQALSLVTAYIELDAGPPVAPASSVDLQRLQRVLARLENQFPAPVPMAELAAEAALSIPAFCRLFKRLTQRTVTEFSHELRVQHACQLLRTSASITEVAYASGFHNLSSFNRVFRQQLGESPSAYRQRVELNGPIRLAIPATSTR